MLEVTDTKDLFLQWHKRSFLAVVSEKIFSRDGVKKDLFLGGEKAVSDLKNLKTHTYNHDKVTVDDNEGGGHGQKKVSYTVLDQIFEIFA
jgi:hypothetical protein